MRPFFLVGSWLFVIGMFVGRTDEVQAFCCLGAVICVGFSAALRALAKGRE